MAGNIKQSNKTQNVQYVMLLSTIEKNKVGNEDEGLALQGVVRGTLVEKVTSEKRSEESKGESSMQWDSMTETCGWPVCGVASVG